VNPRLTLAWFALGVAWAVPARSETVTLARVAATQGIVARWGRAFCSAHPEVQVRQTDRDYANALLEVFRELGTGAVRIAPFPRDIQPAERGTIRRWVGTDPVAIAIATGSFNVPSNASAVAVFVNRANPLSRLTLPQLDAIFSAERRLGYPEPIVRWGQLGLKGAWAPRPIHAIGMTLDNARGQPHGIVYYLMRHAFGGGPFRPDLVQVPDTGIGRGNNHAFDEIVRRVADDPDAIGYAGFFNHAAGAKTVALGWGADGPFVCGTPATVRNRTYPLLRTVYVYVKPAPSGGLDPLTREFLDFALSPAGQRAVAEDPAGLLPLPSAFAAAERRKLARP
jgi:phosphate transport system substrate-binding protein